MKHRKDNELIIEAKKSYIPLWVQRIIWRLK